ncbi:MAG: DUF3187 family protein [Armatimonadetes bacterium]|nr:DUF3187 family protein [Armatimonadota bacterium]
MLWPAVIIAACSYIPNLNEGFGPIDSRNHRALSLTFLRFSPSDRVLSNREREFSFRVTSANDFRQVPGLLEDQETERLAFKWKRGFAKGDLEVEVPFLFRGGGFLDPIILGWHEHILHWVEPGRAEAPSGRSIVEGPGFSFGSAGGLGDISVFWNQRLNGHWSWSSGVKAPTGNAHTLMGSGAFDAGQMMKYVGRLGKGWSFHGELGLIAQGKPTVLPGGRGLVHQEGMALTWQPNSRDNWVAQWQAEASALQLGIPGSDATHRMLVFGYQRRLSNREVLELCFMEDRDVFNGRWPEGANIAPDFSIQAGITLRY